MNRTDKLRLLLFTLFALTFGFCGRAMAKDEFDTSYEVIYLVNSSGKTHVSQQIKLTNRYSNLYATQYSLFLKGLKIENIQASDEIGPLKTEVSSTGDTHKITLYFNQQAVGLGKSLNFKLTYDAMELASKNGQIWEINIPRISELEPSSGYSVTLSVPQNFGKLAFIRPSPIGQTSEAGYNHYQFSKDQLFNTGVNAVLGEFQIFNFTLTYPLDNSGSSTKDLEITLPPDTAYQQLSYESLMPSPINVRVDQDGNWLAGYRLKAGEKFSVIATGQVKIFPDPRKDFPPPSVDNLSQNLLPQKYWEVDSQIISTKARQLKTVGNIYYFVVDSLNYDLNRVKVNVDRLGALKALENPDQAICMEFTDLFIALCRAAGIPAREINGFAYTTNEKLQPLGLVADILHSWPEYYDNDLNQWIPVDPTWEKTSGGIDHFSKPDLNHFSFVIHGENSENPLSAGFHQAQDFQKNIEVAFGDYRPPISTVLQAEFKLPKEIFLGIAKKGLATVKNPGPSAIFNLEVKLESDNLTILFSKDPILPIKIGVFPPFAKQTYNFELKTNNFFNPYWEKITLFADGQQFIQWLKIGFPYTGILILFLTLIIFASLVFFLTKILIYVKNRR